MHRSMLTHTSSFNGRFATATEVELDQRVITITAAFAAIALSVVANARFYPALRNGAECSHGRQLTLKNLLRLLLAQWQTLPNTSVLTATVTRDFERGRRLAGRASRQAPRRWLGVRRGCW